MPNKRSVIPTCKGGVVRSGETPWSEQIPHTAAYLFGSGRSDLEVADALGVKLKTLNRWIRTVPEMAHARENSRAHVEARLADALMVAAEGAVKVEVTEALDEETGEWVAHTRKRTNLPPDPRAATAYLERRHGEDWKAKQEIVLQPDEETRAVLEEGRERMMAAIRGAQGRGE